MNDLPEPEPVRWPKLVLLKQLTALVTGGIIKPTDKNYQPMKLKPGIASTELWVTIGAGVITTALAVLDKMDGSYAAVGVTILGALYTLLRSNLKAKG
jgi:hypothetical protein